MDNPNIDNNILGKCLEGIGLPTLNSVFQREKIEACMVETLSDSELHRMGVQTNGDRHRLRQSIKCRLSQGDSHIENKTESNLLRVIQHERRLLFRPYASQTGNKNGRKKGKCIRGWTFNFICLSNKSSSTVPTATEKEILIKAGETAVLEKLISDQVLDNEVLGFPKLRNAYVMLMLLRTTQNCRNLTVIDCVWSTKEIKAILSPQSNIYLRPIPANLSTETLKELDDSTSKQQMVETKCVGCQKNFKLRELREHLDTCPVPVADTSNIQFTNSKTETVSNVLNYAEENENSVATSVISEQALNDEDNIAANVDFKDTETENQASEKLHILVTLTTKNIVQQVIKYCSDENISNPVEILRKLQTELVTGRPLEIEDITSCTDGDTNFILIDRNNVLSTGFDEVRSLDDPRKTLEVQFYGEISKLHSSFHFIQYLNHLRIQYWGTNNVAVDYGGPRKEFFRLILMEIKEKYFDNGLRDLLFQDYKACPSFGERSAGYWYHLLESVVCHHQLEPVVDHHLLDPVAVYHLLEPVAGHHPLETVADQDLPLPFIRHEVVMDHGVRLTLKNLLCPCYEHNLFHIFVLFITKTKISCFTKVLCYEQNTDLKQQF
ncbi:hypothetical protein KUTeg_009168 [Tegillarca granosa]|uniref:SAM domain-containing protein n=1 Tax=Tegillarca granosa TaxID=220873 RepID=A0ABQ9F7C0_TEGGR|nr:hypothetical protein KUTeg_009168 [Tegillarca granosa]